ncbi:MAG: lipid A phosphoethanolamine transferase [Paludibacteraceae bacterium]|nr:lipid A phosphoethanolamine transferase [Paludibacteraceae bacterium]
MSYLLTSVIFALPIVGLSSLIHRKWIYWVVIAVLTIFSIAELTMVDLYGEYLLPGSIYSFIRTNSQEASEFYKTNLGEVINWIPVVMLCVISGLLYSIPKYLKWLEGVMLLLTILLPTGFVFYKMVGFYNNQLTLRYYVDKRILNRPPYNIVYQSLQTYNEIKKRKAVEHAKDINFGAKQVTKIDKKQVYVLAIGESLRYDNISLNGKYPRSTTPRLEALDNLVLFDDYYSQACLTMYSIPQLVTRATPDNYQLNFAERSIIEPFREAGFHTYTIVNNNLLSYEKYLSDGVDSLIIIHNVVKDGEILSGDKTIVHIIDSLVQEHDKLFILIQFYGNHSFFTNYEKEFDVYQPNSNDEEAMRDSILLINAYDNSILYTDYILSSIINVIDQPNTVSGFMFMSDHGEFIGNGGAGHGGNCTPLRTEYHVPYIFWWSKGYEDIFPEKVAMAKKNKQAKINGDCVFYSVCDMADIQLDSAYNQPTWSVVSPKFKEHQRLILVPDGVTTINPDI